MRGAVVRSESLRLITWTRVYDLHVHVIPSSSHSLAVALDKPHCDLERMYSINLYAHMLLGSTMGDSLCCGGKLSHR